MNPPSSDKIVNFLQSPKQIILAVDDSPENLTVLSNIFDSQYLVKVTTKGSKAIEIARRPPQPDLILLDVVMPEIDGYEVCRQLKADPETRNIPIIFVTSRNEVEDELKGFDIGGLDYISKPFHPAIIRARVQTHLELKRERQKTDKLLENVLPRKVVEDLKLHDKSVPEQFGNVSIMFVDLVGFTPAAAKMTPIQLISDLSEIFSSFDTIMAENKAERIKTIGDAYLAVCGMPSPNSDHAGILIKCGVEFLRAMRKFNDRHGTKWQIRVGIHSGPVVGGIVGKTRFLYDIFGDSVNTASRIESVAQPMTVFVSEDTRNLAGKAFEFISQGLCELKGKGKMHLYSVKE